MILKTTTVSVAFRFLHVISEVKPLGLREQEAQLTSVNEESKKSLQRSQANDKGACTEKTSLLPSNFFEVFLLLSVV